MSHGSFGCTFLNLSAVGLSQTLKAESICLCIDSSVSFGVKFVIQQVKTRLFHFCFISSTFCGTDKFEG